MMDIVRKIDSLVVPSMRPGIFLSGGLDSSIVLYHLSKKMTNLTAYIAKFGLSSDEDDIACKMAKECNVTYKVINIENIFDPVTESIHLFDRPQYNLWPYELFKKAKNDGIDTIYLGEGGDEHFGGYKYVPSPAKNHEPHLYEQWWSSLLTWILPTYQKFADHFNIDLQCPLFALNITETKELHCPPNKYMLRHAYRNLLPIFILEKKKQPPLDVTSKEVWDKMLSKYYPDDVYKSKQDSKDKIQQLVSKMWLESRGNK